MDVQKSPSFLKVSMIEWMKSIRKLMKNSSIKPLGNLKGILKESKPTELPAPSELKIPSTK